MTLLCATPVDAIAAGRRRRFDEGQFRGIAEYLFESAPGEALGPQALIARQAPHWSLPTHFHMQHQFQVVLRGEGRLGTHSLRPGSVHYTSPQSGYGPIVAGPDGLDYVTLRVLTDKGAWYLPEARAYMQTGLRKEQQWGAAPDFVNGPGLRTLIAARGDGLGAWAWSGGHDQEFTCDEPASPAGRFHVVIAGRFRHSGQVLPPGSCVYWAAPSAAPLFTALEPDSIIVIAQFPEVALHNDVTPELRIAPSARGMPMQPGAGG